MRSLLQELRYSSRMFAKKPSFTVIAAITLAAGIGLNTAIFSVVNSILLRPLPYQEPERLVQVLARIEKLPGVQSAGLTSSPPMIKLNNMSSGFEIEGQPIDPGRAPMAKYGVASPDYFHALGIPLIKGRAFTERDTSDAAPVAIIW